MYAVALNSPLHEAEVLLAGRKPAAWQLLSLLVAQLHVGAVGAAAAAEEATQAGGGEVQACPCRVAGQKQQELQEARDSLKHTVLVLAWCSNTRSSAQL